MSAVLINVTYQGQSGSYYAHIDPGVDDAKRELRARMRTLRRELSDRPERSARIWKRLIATDAVIAVSTTIAADDSTASRIRR